MSTPEPTPLDYETPPPRVTVSVWAWLSFGSALLSCATCVVGVGPLGEAALALAGAAGFIALVSGIVGLVKTASRRQTGRGAAWFGTVGGLVSVALLFLLPTLGRAREPSKRIRCGSNMRQIGQALQLYAADFNGQFPPDLETLAANSDVLLDTLICPSTETQSAMPPFALGINCDYLYLGSGLTTDAAPSTVVLIEPLSNHHKSGYADGAHVLRADGSVQFLPAAQAGALLSAPLAPGR